MKIIRNNNELISLFPEYYNNLDIKNLKISKYIEIQYVNDNNIVLYSFISDSIFLLSVEEYEMFINMNFKKNKGLFKILQQNGFFIDKKIDELDIMLKHRINMGSYLSQTMKVVILPTTDCNARCKYCIGYKNKRINMSMETANDVVNYIVHQSEKYKSIRLDWYGGEPLMEKDIISYICKEINRLLPEKEYSSVITTNLSLFDEKTLEEAKNIWHVKKINITIDGFEENHNNKKNYLNSNLNGYKHTLQCIKNILENEINVFCRFNIDRNNINELSIVLEDLKKFYNHKQFYFFVSPLRGEDSHSEFYETSEYNDLFYETGKLLIEKGFKNEIDSFVPRVALGLCLAKSRNCFVIGPNGLLYRCNLDDLKIENSTGNVVDGLSVNHIYDRFTNLKLQKKCEICKYLPICQGGCPTEKAQESKSNNQCLKFKFKLKAISKLLAEYYC